MNPIVEKVYQIGIIPVIAFNSVDEALPLCKALADGGLPAAEVTFRTACAEECIRKIHEEMPEMLLGAGTVLTTEQADRAMAAGASFIVAPGFDPEVCKHVIDKGGIMMPGTCSAGEMQQAMNMGCEALKFFPAEANGCLLYTSLRLQRLLLPRARCRLRSPRRGDVRSPQGLPHQRVRRAAAAHQAL